MGKGNEILIVHHSADDTPIGGSGRGWVSNFYKFLIYLFDQVADEKVTIKRVSENDSSLQNDIQAASIVIPVLSSHFLEDENLVDTTNSFVKNLSRGDDTQRELFKVIKFPDDIDKVLPQLRDMPSYDFYKVDLSTGETQEYNRFFDSEAEKGYWMKMVDLAYDIIDFTKTYSSLQANVDEKPKTTRDKTVYLASTGVDVVIQRDVVKRELIRHGYRVLPEHPLPNDIKLLESEMKTDLEKCCLSIHLIGEDYGVKLNNSDLSFVDVQNKIASHYAHAVHEYNITHATTEKFSRLVWLSPDLNNVSERQKIFIEDLKSDASSLDEAEVLQITLQEMKGIIREELMTGGRFNFDVKTTQKSLKDISNSIYLLYDQLDIEAVKELQAYLESNNYTVVKPKFDGDLSDIRFLHQENLRRCDAAIIYHGRSSNQWVESKLQDLLKAPGFGRTKTMLGVAVYSEDRNITDLRKIHLSRTMVLGGEAFDPQQIDTFLNKLKK